MGKLTLSERLQVVSKEQALTSQRNKLLTLVASIASITTTSTYLDVPLTMSAALEEILWPLKYHLLQKIPKSTTSVM